MKIQARRAKSNDDVNSCSLCPNRINKDDIVLVISPDTARYGTGMWFHSWCVTGLFSKLTYDVDQEIAEIERRVKETGSSFHHVPAHG